MTLFPSREILRRRADIGLIVAFVVFLWLPTADKFLRLDHAPSPNENRRLATFPSLRPGLSGASEFLTGLENYFKDNFGFRRQLVRWERHWKWLAFHDARTGEVLEGKDGWLFFANGLMIDDVCSARPFTSAELEAWRTLLTGRHDWLKERGIRYLFVIPPDKHAIYPEHLPDWLLASARKPQRIDQFLDYMRAHTNVPILDLRATLLDAKKEGSVFLKTDTHWNDRGAFAACRRIVQELASRGMPVVAPAIEAFDENLIDSPGGDLALMLQQMDSRPEMRRPVLTPRPPQPPLEAHVEMNLVPKKWVPGTEPMLSENPHATGKVVMFRDSYGIALTRFFGYSFSRVVYLWQQNWDKPFLDREKPDIVIDEMLERFVIARSPEELRKKDEQPDAQVTADF
jgi:hypothetical protein